MGTGPGSIVTWIHVPRHASRIFVKIEALVSLNTGTAEIILGHLGAVIIPI
jgi:hypothetical protein